MHWQAQGNSLAEKATLANTIELPAGAKLFN